MSVKNLSVSEGAISKASSTNRSRLRLRKVILWNEITLDGFFEGPYERQMAP
jgi:hypothetical protein